MPGQHQLSQLFVLHGDIARVHADGYVVPSGSRLEFGERWQGILGEGPHRVPVPTLHDPIAVKPGRLKWMSVASPTPDGAATGAGPDRRLMLVTDIASGVESIDWLVSGLATALDEAAAQWASGSDTRRERPLLAMPLLGSGRGGFRGIQGKVVRAILGTLDERLPRLPFDVVLVCFTRAQYAAVQHVRLQQGLCLPDMPAHLEGIVEGLSQSAARGSLGILFGAGVSIPLGLPSWADLLRELAAGTSAGDLGDLSQLDPMDAASLVMSALAHEDGAQQFQTRIAESVNVTRHSLAHGLLASMRPTVAVTTNYDRGYELALRHVVGRDPAVMPWESPESAAAPRVLKLHGDVKLGSIVLGREDFVLMHATRRPLTALLQEQMLAHHVLAVGTSMSDSTLVSAIAEASTLLASIRTDKKLGTLVMTQRNPARAALLSQSMHVFFADESIPGDDVRLGPPAAARVTDLLLDAVALRSTSDLNYLADEQFLDLVKDQSRLVDVAVRARGLRSAIEAATATDTGTPAEWRQILTALDGLGATRPSTAGMSSPAPSPRVLGQDARTAARSRSGPSDPAPANPGSSLREGPAMGSGHRGDSCR